MLFLLASQYLPGFHLNGLGAAILVAIALGLVNSILRPIVSLLTLPLNILSLGLFAFVINALMLGLVAFVVPGFHVENFFSALLAAVALSFANTLLSVVGLQSRSI
ncbi:MAG: phage holin family protein [Cyanobacteria bacterium P01_H01_bin.74]